MNIPLMGLSSNVFYGSTIRSRGSVCGSGIKGGVVVEIILEVVVVHEVVVEIVIVIVVG